MKKHLVVLAPTWPGEFSGHAIAFYATLRSLVDQFEVVNYIVGLADVPRPSSLPFAGKVNYWELGITRGSYVFRFFRSLFGRDPAICDQFSNRASRACFNSTIDELIYKFGIVDVLFVEHLPIYSLIEGRSDKIANRVVVRSHDVLIDAFSDFKNKGFWLRRLAWRIEVNKIRNFERRIILAVPHFAAISEEDGSRYLKIYGERPGACLGVIIDIQGLSNVAQGRRLTVLHIGGIDLRKKGGVTNLIESVWPVVRRSVPSASLVLVGGGSAELNNSELGIRGLGIVDDISELWSSGAVFVNPQDSGSGVKLKSLNAMAAGKALVSTDNGVSGLSVVDGVHYAGTKNSLGLSEVLIKVLLDEDMQDRLSVGARKWVDENCRDAVVIGNYLKFVCDS